MTQRKADQERADKNDALGRQHYNDFGPLTSGDVMMLAKYTETRRRRVLTAWYGPLGSRYAKMQYHLIVLRNLRKINDKTNDKVYTSS